MERNNCVDQLIKATYDKRSELEHNVEKVTKDGVTGGFTRTICTLQDQWWRFNSENWNFEILWVFYVLV